MRIGSFDDRNSAIKADKKLENQAKNHLIINRVKKKQKSDIKSALQSPNIRKQKKKRIVMIPVDCFWAWLNPSRLGH